MSTMIIAEAGVNHNGRIDMATRLVDVAAASGADWVKFQTFRADSLVTAEAPKANYQKVGEEDIQTQWEMLKALELSDNDHHVLKAQCSRQGIGFLSTGFDQESIDFLYSMGMQLFKIPSGEITNLRYLQHVGALKCQVLLSTGMSTLGDVEAALEVLTRAGTPLANITVLHCTSAYPTAMQDVNLRAMLTLGEAFGVKFGYSDHTPGYEVSVAAVALGACVIEKHFTLDRTLPGPDHLASLEPEELRAMVKAIRNVEQALGSGVKKPCHAELANLTIARRSLVARRAIFAGDLFTPENVHAMRPGTGMSPMRWHEIVGRSSPRSYKPGELIEP